MSSYLFIFVTTHTFWEPLLLQFHIIGYLTNYFAIDSFPEFVIMIDKKEKQEWRKYEEKKCDF